MIKNKDLKKISTLAHELELETRRRDRFQIAIDQQGEMEVKLYVSVNDFGSRVSVSSNSEIGRRTLQMSVDHIDKEIDYISSKLIDLGVPVGKNQ